jgi:WD40-like Beta Propeller Repeat
MSRGRRSLSVPKSTAAGLVALVAALAWTMLAWATPSTKARNGPLTIFTGGTSSPDQVGQGTTSVGRIMTVGDGKRTTIWHCPGDVWCGEAVSFAWGPAGRRVAFTLDEIGGNSPYVGFHVLNAVSGQDRQIPHERVGCWPARELAWSPQGTSLAYVCTYPHNSELEVLKLSGAGYTTVPTGPAPDANWPSWSPSGTRIAYSTQLTPTEWSEIYTVALDGSHRRLVASGGAAPAWSPDGRTIAYQTTCGLRLVTPSGKDVTPRPMAKWCGPTDASGPPVWSPDGTKIAIEGTNGAGIRVMNKTGRARHLVSHYAQRSWYGGLPGRPSWRATP